jgi:selenocysteine lyase/cysteine desulfurase
MTGRNTLRVDPTAARALFELPDDVAYLNCAYMSPQLSAVREAGEVAIRRKSRPWEIAPSDFFEGSERLRQLAARVMGVDDRGIALVPAASYGMAVAAANLPVSPGGRVVVLAEEFPSDIYAWNARKTELVTVPRPADFDWTAALLDAIDDRASVVVVSQCHWTDGSLVDLAAVAARARDVGAALVIDASQSLGAFPLDMAAVDPDFLIAVGYKWLLGPYSLGYMYVHPRWRDGHPIEHNWIQREGSEDFSRLIDYRDEMKPGAQRFDVGERSNHALVPMATAALDQILDWGIGNIASAAAGVTGDIEERARNLGLEPVPASRRGSHMIGIRVPGGLPLDLPSRLAAARVFVSVRGDSIRVAPHLYTTREDIDRLFSVLAA